MLVIKPGGIKMEHETAVQQMAVERYLLDELSPELREEFEEHLFDCAECSLDLRAGAAFVEEAKLQLPNLVSTAPAAAPRPETRRPQNRGIDWLAWLRPVLTRPAFAAPVFAVMLLVIGYQNLATIPSLRSAAAQPRLAPWVSFHTGTRGDAHLTVPADPAQGAVLLIQIPEDGGYASYSFDLYDPQGKRVWTQSEAASTQPAMGGGAFSLMIPGAGLAQASYTLVVSGVNPQGGRTEIDRRILDFHLNR
jgi:putative zinc finger protein